MLNHHGSRNNTERTKECDTLNGLALKVKVERQIRPNYQRIEPENRPKFLLCFPFRNFSHRGRNFRQTGKFFASIENSTHSQNHKSSGFFQCRELNLELFGN